MIDASNCGSLYPKILISGDYNVFNEGWNGNGIYMCSGKYESSVFKLPIYIGSAAGLKGLQDRIENRHISTLNRNCHSHNPPLQIAWNNHSLKEDFIWWLLEPCTRENQFKVEQKWLDFYRPFVDEFGGFNINHFAGGGCSIKRKKTLEERTKISQKLIANKENTKKLRILAESQKKTAELKNPNGEIVYIKGLKEFCEKNNLNLGCISSLINGKGRSYKGWTRINEKNDYIPNNRPKSTILINPNGDVIKIYNINKFCKENDLNQGRITLLIQGKAKSHKGWKKYD